MNCVRYYEIDLRGESRRSSVGPASAAAVCCVVSCRHTVSLCCCILLTTYASPTPAGTTMHNTTGNKIGAIENLGVTQVGLLLVKRPEHTR